MKIDSPKISEVYETYTKFNSNANNGNISKKNDPSKDKVEISDMGLKASDLAPIRSKIVSEIEEGTSKEKLQALKASVDNGTYDVSNEDLAGAMLNAPNNK